MAFIENLGSGKKTDFKLAINSWAIGQVSRINDTYLQLKLATLFTTAPVLCSLLSWYSIALRASK